ncbi:MAG: tetratricopeptide repeat protein, partial [Caulobacterales bacterium]
MKIFPAALIVWLLAAASASASCPRAEAAFSKGDLAGAISAADACIAQSEDVEAYWTRGNARYVTGQRADAARDFAVVVARRPASVDALVMYANSLDDLGETEKALAAFAKAIQLAPTQARPYAERSIAYYRKGDFPKAKADGDKA